MNWVDLVMVIVVTIFALEGLRRGFFSQAIDIIGFFISLILSLTFYPQAAILLTQFFDLPKIAANPVGFLLVWLIVESIFFGIFGNIFKKFTQKYANLIINKYFGFIPASLNALLFLAFVLILVVSLPIRPEIKKDVFDSKSGSFLVEKTTVFEKPFASIFGPIAKQSLTFLTVKPQERGSISLEFTQSNLSIDFVSEQKMLELVNQERLKFGSPSLVWDESLTKVGRNHSRDMFTKGYFSHYSPEGQDVGDRLDEAGINYSLAGENLALAPNITRAHLGLINSEGHRRNILDPAFRKIGIGAIDGGVYGKMFTQVFTD